MSPPPIHIDLDEPQTYLPWLIDFQEPVSCASSQSDAASYNGSYTSHLRKQRISHILPSNMLALWCSDPATPQLAAFESVAPTPRRRFGPTSMRHIPQPGRSYGVGVGPGTRPVRPMAVSRAESETSEDGSKREKCVEEGKREAGAGEDVRTSGKGQKMGGLRRWLSRRRSGGAS